MITMEMLYAACAEAQEQVSEPWYKRGAAPDEEAMTVTVIFHTEAGELVAVKVIAVTET